MLLMLTPITDRGSLVGVIEVVNKLDRTTFDDDDLFTLTEPDRYGVQRAAYAAEHAQRGT